MAVKLASPMFIVRQEAEKDLFTVLEKISALGFEGVELIGFYGKKPTEIRKKLDSLSMKALSDHVNVNDFMKNPQQVLEDHKILGCSYITLAWPNRSIKPGSAEFNTALENIQQASRLCRDAGITAIYHNHDYELEDDPPMLDMIMEACIENGLRMEPDVGWMLFTQTDPATYLRKYRDYCPVIHLKDIYARDLSKTGSGADLGTEKARPDKGYFEFRPTGYGMVNMPTLLPVCLDCKPEWFVIDHDLAYERDSYSDLKMSLEYVQNLLYCLRV